MRILYLVPHIPNPTKARSYYQVLGLLEAGHEVTVATLQRSAEDSHRVQRLREMGANVIAVRLSRTRSLMNGLRVLPSHLPFQTRYMWSRKLMRAIERHLAARPPDIIHVEHLRMACYGLRLVHDWPVVWDAVDHLSSLYRATAAKSASLGWRLVAPLEAPRLQSYECWLTGQFPATLVISQRDYALFQNHNPFASRVQVVPPGLPLTPPPADGPRLTDALIITGTFDYHPNVASVLYFVREVLPLIQQERPNVRLQLVGARPMRAIRALRDSHIEVTGFVPSLIDYLGRATVALAPVLYASGMQNKVIEAFLTETPLVATSVAVQGLGVTHSQHLLIADAPADFAAAVLRLLSDPELRSRIGKAGRRYLEQNHDLAATTRRLVECYREVQERTRAGSPGSEPC